MLLGKTWPRKRMVNLKLTHNKEFKLCLVSNEVPKRLKVAEPDHIKFRSVELLLNFLNENVCFNLSGKTKPVRRAYRI